MHDVSSRTAGFHYDRLMQEAQELLSLSVADSSPPAAAMPAHPAPQALHRPMAMPSMQLALLRQVLRQNVRQSDVAAAALFEEEPAPSHSPSQSNSSASSWDALVDEAILLDQGRQAGAGERNLGEEPTPSHSHSRSNSSASSWGALADAASLLDQERQAGAGERDLGEEPTPSHSHSRSNSSASSWDALADAASLLDQERQAGVSLNQVEHVDPDEQDDATSALRHPTAPEIPVFEAQPRGIRRPASGTRDESRSMRPRLNNMF